MAFYRQIEPIRLKAKGLPKPLKTRLFSANNFFVENKRVLKAFGRFEASSALTIFICFANECLCTFEKKLDAAVGWAVYSPP